MTPPTPNTYNGHPFTPLTPLGVSWPSSCQPTRIREVDAGIGISFKDTYAMAGPGLDFGDSWDACMPWLVCHGGANADQRLTVTPENDSAKKQGLGMNFLDAGVESGTLAMDARVDSLEDIVKLSDFNMRETRNPISPDRRSVSSMSSIDYLADFPELPESLLASGSAMDITNVSTCSTKPDAELVPGTNRGRRGRSASHSLASRQHSNRRFRHSPYLNEHGRRNSISASSTSSVLSLSVPATSCCSPVEERQDDFALDGTPEIERSVEDLGNVDGIVLASRSARPGDLQDVGGLFPIQQSIVPELEYISPPIQSSTFATPASSVFGLPFFQERRDDLDSFEEALPHEDEPDLFSALLEEPSIPSEEELRPSDSEMEPSEQDVRFEGDLYTPRFVRGHGNKREGYCGLCKPGRWLVLKNSAFWYDKSFSHGISAATGQPFDAPRKTRRMYGNPDVWEGLCGTCNEWIALISNRKKGTTWFRHAYKVSLA